MLITLAHAIFTLIMFIMILFIHFVHYPLFQKISADQFSEAMRFHQRRVTLIVVPLMLLEASTAAYLFSFPVLSETTVTVNAILLGVIWLSTFFIQAPQHKRLLKGYNEQLIRQLVALNGIRVFCWGARAVILVFSLVDYFQGLGL